MQQDAGQAEPLCLAAREGVGVGVAFEVEVDDLQLLVAHAAPRRALDPVGGREELEILDHLHVVIDAEEIGHVADQAADFLGLRVDRVAAHIRFAPGRIQQRGDDPHGRRLAGPVGSDEAEQVAFLQLQFDGADGEEVAVFLREIVCLDHRICLWDVSGGSASDSQLCCSLSRVG